MATYFVTFRIGQEIVNGRSDEDRRRQLVENAAEKNGGFWDETTSFLIVTSDLGTNELGERVFDGLSLDYDMALVIDPEDMSIAYFGDYEDEDVLRSFFAYANRHT